MAYRRFYPEKVSDASLGRLTVLYGNDRDGMDMRLDRMAEVLSESSETFEFKDASEAVQLISSGGMFGGGIGVLLRFPADIMKSDRDSKAMRKKLLSAIEGAPEGTRVVLSMMKPSDGVLREFKEFCSKIGALGPREVSVGSDDAVTWLCDVAEANGRPIDRTTAARVVRLLPEDYGMLRGIAVSAGDRLAGMSDDDIRAEYDIAATRRYDTLKQLLSGNIGSVTDYFKTFAEQPSGSLLFVKHLKMLAFDACALLADGTDGHSRYIAYKRRHYDSFNARYVHSDYTFLARYGYAAVYRAYAALRALEARCYADSSIDIGAELLGVAATAQEARFLETVA